MSYISLKAIGLLILMVIAASIILWLFYQQRELYLLRKQKNTLTQQSDLLQNRLLQLKDQAVHLSKALNEQQTLQRQLEHQSEQKRRQLRQTVSQSPCTAQPVPDDVTRLQRAPPDRTTRIR